MEKLQNRIDELQSRTTEFANLCAFVSAANEETIPCENYTKVLSSVLRIVERETAKIDELSDSIFFDKRMMKFYYSLDGDNE